MKKNTLRKFKDLLEKQVEIISESVAPLKQAFAICDDDRMDEIDIANADVERHIAFRLHERHGKFSEKVVGVARTLLDGTFGLCQSCGEEINTARLLARPMTVLCFDCKSEQEHEEKRFRSVPPGPRLRLRFGPSFA